MLITMQVMPQTITARTIQRKYREVFDEVRAKKKPIVVTTNSKPDVAIISMNMLEDLLTSEEDKLHNKLNLPQGLAPQLTNTAELNDSLDALAIANPGKPMSPEETDRLYRTHLVEKYGRYLS
jgi:prevent-host-death family protein